MLDLDSLSKDEFDFIEKKGLTLIRPKKNKFKWKEHELRYRSLLVDESGKVVSSGFPKFFNYGENPEHDRAFERAMARGEVEFYDKLDGTLILISIINGKPHLRTRGSHDLGEFEAEVMALINEKYPDLLTRVEKDVFYGRYTIALEYTSPNNRIVVAYEDSSLTLLGLISNHSSEPYCGLQLICDESHRLAVPYAKPVNLFTFDDLRKLRGQRGIEGVVGYWEERDSFGGITGRLIKIKTDEYFKLHALRFNLEGKGAKIAYLLDIRHPFEIEPHLASIGLDYEAIEVVRQEIEEYIDAYWDVVGRAEEMEWLIRQLKIEASTRKDFVEMIRSTIARNEDWEDWFGVAMLLYDGKREEAYDLALAIDVFGVTGSQIAQWKRDKEEFFDWVGHE